jgi:predicted RNA-binding Zn-ribbon protein involved in translation (DUF1610 family)
MSQCKHTQLLVLTESAERLRCRHCHLVIKAEELGDGGYCPECYEAAGRKYSDFEKVATPAGATVRYRCEECGALLNPRHAEAQK